MRKIELTSLLPASAVPNQSGHSLLQELATTSSAGGSSASSANLGGLLQGPVKDITEQITELARKTSSLNSTQLAQVGATQDNTQAVTNNTTTKSGGASAASQNGDKVSGVLGEKIKLSAVFNGLLLLFRGGGENTSPG